MTSSSVRVENMRCVRVMCAGPSGVGKTELAQHIAASTLLHHPAITHRTNLCDLTDCLYVCLCVRLQTNKQTNVTVLHGTTPAAMREGGAKANCFVQIPMNQVRTQTLRQCHSPCVAVLVSSYIISPSAHVSTTAQLCSSSYASSPYVIIACYVRL